MTPDIETRFSFHPATAKTGPQHDEVRAQHRALAEWIDTAMPNCPEKNAALERLQESMMWCNAAVAYRGKD